MSSGETASCLLALDRFVSVHGRPDRINSDSGANLMGTKREIQRRHEWWTKVRTDSQAAYPLLEWVHNPPYAPNWGGHYERLIGIAKRTLTKVLINHVGVLTDEELNTVLKKVQSLMNDRPITAIIQEDEDMVSLTPNCFLKTGGRRPMIAPINPGDNIVRRYQLMENTLKQFWKRFMKEYVPTLHKTEKWQRKEAPLRVGDVVSVLHSGLPIGRWPLARVAEVYPSKDGQVRTVSLETRINGRKQIIRRSVSGLMPVDVTSRNNY